MPRENPLKDMRVGRWKFHGLTTRRIVSKDPSAPKHPTWKFREPEPYGASCQLTLVHAGNGHYLVNHTLDAKGKRNAEAFLRRARRHIDARLRDRGLPGIRTYEYKQTPELKEHPAARKLITE